MDAANIGNSAIDQIQRQQNDAARNREDGLNAGAGLAEDFDTFLQLLTTQLQNQDPLEPLKTQEFTNQLVQFAGVEQQINTNDRLDQLVDLQGDGKAATAVSFLGETVEAESNVLALRDGTAPLSYDLENRAEVATIQIADQQGNVVRSLEVDTNAGSHDVVWDGTDANGNELPDGNYVMQLQAVDGDNRTVKGNTFTVGQVQGFEQNNGNIELDLGGFSVRLDEVTSVGSAADAGDAGDDTETQEQSV